MKYRTLRKTDLRVSEIGFGLWTLSDPQWGRFTPGEAVALLLRAFDFGINLFDAAETYGHGSSEELLARAFPRARRDEIVIATKVGYDLDGSVLDREVHRGPKQDFSPAFIRRATEQALKRLHTDRIDLLQLHHVHREQITNDELWATLHAMKREGKILHFGATVGPDIGWLYESVHCIQQRQPAVLQHNYNLLESFPGSWIQSASYHSLPEPDSAVEELPKFTHARMEIDPAFPTGFFIRDPLCSGLLGGCSLPEPTFSPDDPRAHRARSWQLNAARKIDALQFLTGKETGRTLSQAALLWLLAEKTVASCLPNIPDETRLREYASVSERNPLTLDELEHVADILSHNFGIRDEPRPYGGTMRWQPRER